MLELLSPAGDLECLETALRFGADAVYLGGPFMQLRASETAFTMENIAIAIEKAHALKKKVYIAVNSFAKNNEIEKIGDYARELYSLHADALIVSDLGAISQISKCSPIEIHVSTQANCCNFMTARTYHELGAKRIVLAREMSLDEIAELRAKTPAELEIEAFVHGAMCMSYSGRCFMSTYLTGRSANRGECTQPCRWRYHLVEQTRPNEFFPVEEDKNGTAILSSRDLKCISFLDKLIEAGVTSFKIEGRMKSPYYVAAVTNAYRRKLDNSAPLEELEHELDCCSHRPYTSGFYFGELNRYAPDSDTAYTQDCIFAGVVKNTLENGKILVQQRNNFKVGDCLEILSPTIRGAFTVTDIIDETGQSLSCAPHPQQLVTLSCPYTPQNGDILRLRR